MSRVRITGFAAAFVALFSLGSLRAYAQPTPTPTRYRLLIADKNIALDLFLPSINRSAVQRNTQISASFVDPIESFSKEGDAAMLSAVRLSKNPVDADWLTIVVQPAAPVLSPLEFRAFALKKFTKDAQAIKYLDHNGIPLARYKTDSLATRIYANFGVSTLGAKLTAHNIEAFLVHETLWARIKFTAGSFGPEEEKLFYSVLESAKFVVTSNPSTSFDYYSIGRAFTAKKDFHRAADNFTSALKLERLHQQLNSSQWYDLIMKSAEASVAISNLSAAAEVLEYGVTRDPENETFLMQLARTHASMGDMTKTLGALEKAFRVMKREKEVFEKTKFPGTTSHTMSLPDLNRDPAFKEMMKDKAFREAVKAFKK